MLLFFFDIGTASVEFGDKRTTPFVSSFLTRTSFSSYACYHDEGSIARGLGAISPPASLCCTETEEKATMLIISPSGSYASSAVPPRCDTFTLCRAFG